MKDIVIIGGGVIGGTLARELTKYKLSVCIAERANDVCMGASKANSGIVHAGFDAAEGSLKAKFNVLGSLMMEDYARELGVKYRRNGALVVAFSEEDLKTLENLLLRGKANGVKQLSIIGAEKLRELEPNVSDRALGALYAPTSAIVCPYGLTIAAIGNAMDNGAELYTDFEVAKAIKIQGGYRLVSSDGKSIEAKIVVDCAGLNAGKIARLFGDTSVNIEGRKGEYILLDRESGGLVSRTMFFTPTNKGKGVLVVPTVDGNIMLGPTAVDAEDDGTDTLSSGLDDIIEKSARMCKSIPLYNTITSFAGIRAASKEHDFIIRESAVAEGLILCAGIESPGLSAAPAIAKYVAEEIIGKKIALFKNENFNGKREPDYFFNTLSEERKNEIIRRDPAYGKIVCRCEKITEGEIIRAIRENPPARDIDGIKRRTRAGMGRCQGGFCQPQVAEILARETGVPLESVTKSGEGSYLVEGKIK